MMNLIQQQDDLRSMPMQRLMQEAQNPSGLYPQYLVVATIKEKTDMQKRAQAQQQSQQQPQETVSEQVIQEGIMSVPPQEPIPAPTGRGILDNPNIPMNMTREEYEAMKAQALLPPGNGYASGGVVRMQKGGGVFETDFRERTRTPQEQAYLETFTPTGVWQSAADYYGERLNFPGLRGLRDIWQKSVTADEAARSELEDGYFFPTLSSSKTYNLGPQSEDEQIPEEVTTEPQVPELMQSVPAYSQPEDKQPITPVTAEPQGGSGAAVQAKDDARNIPVTVAGDDYLSKLMEYVGKKRETLDLSDLRKQERESSFANALVQLGAGIAEGDLAKGIRAAGAAQTRGIEKARELDQAERLMGYQEEKRAIESDIKVLSTLSQLENQLERASMAAKAQGISGIDFASMMKTASERAEKAVERIPNIEKGTPEYVTLFNRALAQIYRQMVSVLPVGVIGTDYSGYSIVPEQ